MTIKLKKSQKILVLNSGDIAWVMQQILQRENRIDRGKEHLWLVCLDQANRVLLVELISLGSFRTTIADPVEIFSFALQKKAAKIILVHNHPSGSLTPSPSDHALTSKMMSIGEFIHVPVIEHLIISETDYYSFVDSGLYEEIDRKKADLTFKESDRLMEQIKKLQVQKERSDRIAKEKVKEADAKVKAADAKALAAEKKVIEMAKRALKKGITMREIVEITGLPENTIKKIRRNKD